MNLIIYAILQYRLLLKERKETKITKIKYGNNYSEEDYLFYDNPAYEEIRVPIKTNMLLKESI
jgi:hypothetical protein